MKHTRYKKRKNVKGEVPVVPLVIVLIMSIIFVTILLDLGKRSPEISGDLDPIAGEVNEGIGNDVTEQEGSDEVVTDGEEEAKNTVSDVNINAGEVNAAVGERKQLYVVQCGVFSSVDNAEALKSELEEFGSPTVITEDGMSKVVFGVYDDLDSKEVISKLESEGFEASRNIKEVVISDAQAQQTYEISNALLVVANEASKDENVAVNSTSLKEWTDELDAVEGGDIALSELKQFINDMPSTIDRNNTGDIYNIVYRSLSGI